jgi:large subunit ribosomal protein L21
MSVICNISWFTRKSLVSGIKRVKTPPDGQRREELQYMYAIIVTGGKQYRVSEGDKIRVEKLDAEEGSAVEIKEVLLLGRDDGPVTGTPLVEGASVKASVIGHGKEDKVIIFKYRRKKNYRRFRGHRQRYTELKVESIDG